MPYLVIMFIMIGGMYLAIDSTAGEREKGSLEPLLTQPVERSTILLAKLSATAVFSSLTLFLVILGLSVAFKYMPIDSVSISIGFIKIVKIFFLYQELQRSTIVSRNGNAYPERPPNHAWFFIS